MKKEFTINLTSAINYSHNGDFKEGYALTVYSPNYKQMDHVCVLDNAFNQSLIKGKDSIKLDDQQLDEIKSTKDEEMSSEGIVQILSSFCELGLLQKCYNSIGEIITTGKRASVDGIEINKQMLEQLNIKDLKNILGEYIANFIIASPGN